MMNYLSGAIKPSGVRRFCLWDLNFLRRPLLEKLQELYPEMVEGVHWDLTEGNLRNVFDYLASIRIAEFPLTHGVNWNERGRIYRCFRQ